MMRKRSFAPVVDNQVRLLILGSLPGEMSLAHSRYYANPKNQFWTLLGDVIAADLVSLQYSERLRVLLQHGIGLWDVIAEAHRIGSLDAKIRDHVHNDLVNLVSNLPNLACIAFNGGTAARLGLKALGQNADRYQIVRLPSSSPAYILPYPVKLSAWQTLKKWITVPPLETPAT